MTCGRARRLLCPDAGPREAGAEIVEAHEHVSRCELCLRFFEDMRRIAHQIRSAAPRPEAPAEVRDRVFKAIARARTGSAAPSGAPAWRRRAGLGAVAVLLLAGSWVGYRAAQRESTPAGDPIGSIVQDRLRAEQGDGLSSGDSLEVARWLADRLPFAVQVPIFPGAGLKGARVLMVDRQLSGVVEYAVDGQPLSYYIFPAAVGERAGPSRVIRLTSRAGFHLATWEDAGLAHALIGVLPEPKLLELARYCIHQMVADARFRGPTSRAGRTVPRASRRAPVLRGTPQPHFTGAR